MLVMQGKSRISNNTKTWIAIKGQKGTVNMQTSRCAAALPISDKTHAGPKGGERNDTCMIDAKQNAKAYRVVAKFYHYRQKHRHRQKHICRPNPRTFPKTKNTSIITKRIPKGEYIQTDNGICNIRGAAGKRICTGKNGCAEVIQIIIPTDLKARRNASRK